MPRAPQARTRVAFTSDDTDYLDQVARTHGWVKRKSVLGDEVTYSRLASKLCLVITANGCVVGGETTRQGGMQMPKLRRVEWCEAVMATPVGKTISY